MTSDGKATGRLSGQVCAITPHVALFLAPDERSSVTGVDIVVDGGTKVW